MCVSAHRLRRCVPWGVLSAPQEHTRLHPLLQTTKPSQRTLKHLQTKRICVFIEGMFRSMIKNHSEV